MSHSVLQAGGKIEIWGKVEIQAKLIKVTPRILGTLGMWCWNR